MAEGEPESPATLPSKLREYEARLIRQALREAGGNQGVAARKLGVPLRTLVYKLRRLRIRASDTDVP